ncbi:aromatic-ring-hydroxylating dioxygenase subunit beta [Comamonas sp. F1-6]|uniref:aromatic-ring-hydroxylating dioxygenase subunit beta n=1 Tax=Comamonas sp. F1-6 TaxID=673550 RepID=UPI0031D1B863
MTDTTQPITPVQFVLNEAKLLNEARYTEWLSLFAQDGRYWVPLTGDQQSDPFSENSLAYEDRILLATRIQRLHGARAHSLEPGARSVHVLQIPQAQAASLEGDDWKVYTPFVYIETRGSRQNMLAGTWRHRLRQNASGFEIVLKRVDLLNAPAAHEMIQLFP